MSALWTLDPAALRSRYPFASLVRPLVGLVENVSSLQQRYGDPVLEVGVTSLNNLTMAFPHVMTSSGLGIQDASLGGAGGDTDPELAWVRAVAEGVERYATCVHMPDDFVAASSAGTGRLRARSCYGAASVGPGVCGSRVSAHPSRSARGDTMGAGSLAD